MREVACGIHALDSALNDECVNCLKARIAARDAEIKRLRADILWLLDHCSLPIIPSRDFLEEDRYAAICKAVEAAGEGASDDN